LDQTTFRLEEKNLKFYFWFLDLDPRSIPPPTVKHKPAHQMPKSHTEYCISKNSHNAFTGTIYLHCWKPQKL